jgi:hypothetical protein
MRGISRPLLSADFLSYTLAHSAADTQKPCSIWYRHPRHGEFIELHYSKKDNREVIINLSPYNKDGERFFCESNLLDLPIEVKAGLVKDLFRVNPSQFILSDPLIFVLPFSNQPDAGLDLFGQFVCLPSADRDTLYVGENSLRWPVCKSSEATSLYLNRGEWCIRQSSSRHRGQLNFCSKSENGAIFPEIPLRTSRWQNIGTLANPLPQEIPFSVIQQIFRYQISLSNQGEGHPFSAVYFETATGVRQLFVSPTTGEYRQEKV